MHQSNGSRTESGTERVARLEARVEALERMVARMSALLARPAVPVQVAAASPAAARPAAAMPPAAPTPAPAAPIPFSLDVSSADAPTQRLPVLKADKDTRSTLDRLGITAAFATLDQHVAEATRSEAAQSEAARARPAPLSLSEICIDESLIDKAFARPPPEKLHVIADIEALHPRIAERVSNTWRTPELLAYLKKLIVDERGDRAGFSPEVMSELLLLSAVLEAPDEPDKWNANARTM